MMIYWTILFPFFCLFSLMKNKHNLDDTNVKFRFGFFYIGYKPDLFFWEFVIMYRKICTIGVSMINDSAIFSKGALVLLLNTFSLFFHAGKKPFVDRRLNFLEYLAILVSVITIFGGLFYLQDIGETFQAFIFIFIVLLNSFFTFMWTITVLLHTFKKLARNKFLKKFSSLIGKITSLSQSFLSNIIY